MGEKGFNIGDRLPTLDEVYPVLWTVCLLIPGLPQNGGDCGKRTLQRHRASRCSSSPLWVPDDFPERPLNLRPCVGDRRRIATLWVGLHRRRGLVVHGIDVRAPLKV